MLTAAQPLSSSLRLVSPLPVPSTGFDGRVFVTDLLRIMTALQTHSKSTENILYPCDAVVGSVQWVPGGTHPRPTTTAFDTWCLLVAAELIFASTYRSTHGVSDDR